MSQKDIPVAVVKRARLLARRIKRERGAGRSSARGVIVLFSGASGPRSTTAAEVLANELGLDLCRVDLGAVVSKYIGETEKNLKRLFDAVDVSDMIFFFDEADALFGRRTEVKDAHDRYANTELSYLLELIEEYQSLAILATNRKEALPATLLRRIDFEVPFPKPRKTPRS